MCSDLRFEIHAEVQAASARLRDCGAHSHPHPTFVEYRDAVDVRNGHAQVLPVSGRVEL